MIIEKLDEEFKDEEKFVKLNEKAYNIELQLSNLDIDKTASQIILTRINELFTIYKQNCTNTDMQKHLLIIEVAIQELLLILQKLINSKVK